MSVKGSNQSLVKITNQRLILQTIREKKRMSRSDLAKELQISNPSISKHVDELLEKKILIETETVITEVGRHPIMLEFNAQYGCVAFVDLFAPDARICITDLLGNKLEYTRVALDDPMTTTTFEHVIAIMREMLDAVGDRCGGLLSICIGVRGVISPQDGRILSTKHVEDFKNIDLRGMFQKAFDVPVNIKNTANLSITGEYRYSEHRYCERFASIGYLALDSEVGMSAIIGGRLYEGRRGFACDASAVISTGRLINHPVDWNEFDVSDIRLEKYTNLNNITEDFRHSLEEGRESIVRDWISSPSEVTFDDIARAYGMNDFLAVSYIKRFAFLIAGLCHNLSSFFDFEAILLGSWMVKLGDSFVTEVRNIFERLTTEYHKAVEINLSTLYDTAPILGGIRVATTDAINRVICPDEDYADSHISF